MTERFTYKDAGVDIELADRVIGSLAERIKRTFRPEVIGRFGGFAAMFRPEWRRCEDPVLVAATDGVGTKLKIAFLTGIHDTVGIDLVAMNVNDILVTGAEPLFFLDYVATGVIEAETVTAVISGIANGCEQAGCALIGGETAEMPDFYSKGEYDLAGFCVGLVDRATALDGSRVKSGDAVIGVASSGLHSNGYSLVRKVLFERKGYSVDSRLADLDRPLGEELLTPTRIYVKPVLELINKVGVSAMAHITGGGFVGNIPRVIPDGCGVVINSSSWDAPPIFGIMAREAGLDSREMFRTFNMGVGFVIVVPPEHADRTRGLLADSGLQSWTIGRVTSLGPGDERVVIQ
ncbi:MAG: phosphoribosylformylglycinamidine cyclo-ligase [Desulfomonile sp.]|nr:phosphoribosylformylglycinamidine cyclo-ligase [Desulfomonile sp.]